MIRCILFRELGASQEMEEYWEEEVYEEVVGGGGGAKRMHFACHFSDLISWTSELALSQHKLGST